MVECFPWTEEVIGSSPIIQIDLTILIGTHSKTLQNILISKKVKNVNVPSIIMGIVVKLVNTHDCDSCHCRFEFCQSHQYAEVAQLVEHLVSTQKVADSISVFRFTLAV